MSGRHRGLGRGLGALIPGAATPSGLIQLGVNDIAPNPRQPRHDIGVESLRDLVGSISEHGLLQPLIVTERSPAEAADGPRYQIIAGERRFRAAKALKLDKIPAIVKDVKDEEALVISLIENIQREGLNPIEEAHAFEKLLSNFNFSQDNIAKALGKDKATISNILRLLKLPLDIQKHLAKGDITLGHAKVLLATEDVGKQRKLCQLIIANSLSVRELENAINISIVGISLILRALTMGRLTSIRRPADWFASLNADNSNGGICLTGSFLIPCVFLHWTGGVLC